MPSRANPPLLSVLLLLTAASIAAAQPTTPIYTPNTLTQGVARDIYKELI
jgi:hypothetical protein